MPNIILPEQFRSYGWEERSEFLREYLSSDSGNTSRAFDYPSKERFVADHGLGFGAAALPALVRGAELGGCFNAAYLIAQDYPNFAYVEGFAVPSNVSEFHHHAWCIHLPDGAIIDATWQNPAECTYLGIGFELPYLTELANQYNMNPTMLDLTERDHPLLRGDIALTDVAKAGYFRPSQQAQ